MSGKMNKARLDQVYRALDSMTLFLKSALPFINSHLTDFFTSSYWDTMLPEALREDLDSKSLQEVKDHVKYMTDGGWKNCSYYKGKQDFNKMETLQDLVFCAGGFQLSSINMSIPAKNFTVDGRKICNSDSIFDEDLKFDRIMSAKKTHEVEIMADFIKTVCNSSPADLEEDLSLHAEQIKYLVDVGSGKGYLSSYLTLAHQFNVLGIDSLEINSQGCEKRSSRLERFWGQLLRRAIERKLYGKCVRRGKHWNRKTKATIPDPQKTQPMSQKVVAASPGVASSEEDQASMNLETLSLTSGEDSQVNKVLKLLTQFVTPDFDLARSVKDHFPEFSCEDEEKFFGLIGLHTCGNLGVDSLKLFVANKRAKFICNVPCCYHLLEENPLFYPSRRYEGSKVGLRDNGEMVDAVLRPGFPISKKLDQGDSSRFSLGRNARLVSAYSLPRMVADEEGLEMNRSIFYRSVLQVVIKMGLKENFHVFNDNQYKHKVGKIGQKCSNFKEYANEGLKNLELNFTCQPSDEEIDEVYHTLENEKERLHKYYLVRSLFAPLVEGCILLDRLAFLLEQECIQEAAIVELFDPAISPRSHAIFGYKAEVARR